MNKCITMYLNNGIQTMSHDCTDLQTDNMMRAKIWHAHKSKCTFFDQTLSTKINSHTTFKTSFFDRESYRRYQPTIIWWNYGTQIIGRCHFGKKLCLGSLRLSSFCVWFTFLGQLLSFRNKSSTFISDCQNKIRSLI